MKTIYLDIFSGISGDMFIGALLDLGVEAHRFEHALARLGLADYHVHVSRQQRAHIAGTKFDVHLVHDHEDHAHREHGHEHSHGQAHAHEHHHAEHGGGVGHDNHDREHAHRGFADIKRLITDSTLSDWVKQKSIAIFQRVADAEGKIHGQPAEAVQFHEVGAIDSIVDIVGACVALELLGRPRLLAAPVIEGTGWVQCAHGRFPVPTPATLEILGARGIPVTQCDEPHELVTPTGAALLAELVESFGPMRGLTPHKIGYGLGTRENQTRPNVLRAILAHVGDPACAHDWETDTIAVLETNLDDTTAELLGSVVEKALAQGALDVFHTPVQMKKNRPGVLLSVLCAESEADTFSEFILRETTAFGVRRHSTERRKLRREFTSVPTPFGEVKIKLGKLDGRVVQAAPEFESCRRLADEARVPLKQVYDEANRALKI